MRKSLISKPSIFQGLNISKLPISHRGSCYLIPEIRAFGKSGQDRFQNLVNEWGSSHDSINLIFGKIDKGRVKGGIHLDYVAVADDKFISLTERFVKPNKKQTKIEKRRVKRECPNAISGFRDTIHFVECTDMKGDSTKISAEKVIDNVAAVLYVSKGIDYGYNTVYYIKPNYDL